MLARVPKSEPCDWGPAVGNTARIVLDLPGSTSFAPKCLECEAIVVRVGEPQDDYQDFGFRIRRMQFRNRDTLSRMLLTTAGASPGLKHLV